MTWEQIFYRGGKAFTIGAVIDLIGISLFLLSLNIPQIPGLVFSILFMIASVNTMFGILALYGSQMIETGKLGFNGFVTAITGMVLGVSNFFTPFTWFIYYIGVAMLAVANSKANHYPTSNIWYWLIGSIIGLAGFLSGIHALTVIGTVLSSFGRFQLGKLIMARYLPDSR